jgi:hypothetical protein
MREFDVSDPQMRMYIFLVSNESEIPESEGLASGKSKNRSSATR